MFTVPCVMAEAPSDVGIGNVTARYWKLNILSTVQNDGYVNCWLIGLSRIKNDRINQCGLIGGTSTESSVFSGEYSSLQAWDRLGYNVTEPVGSTYWHSGNQASPWWTIFDSGVGKSISASQLALQGANIYARMPASFQLLASNDGSTWTQVLSVTGITNWVLNTTQFFDIPQVAIP